MSDIKKIERYHGVAIALHWLMAIGFLVMLGSGVALAYFQLDLAFKFQLYQWHKSGGVLLLLAFIVRVGWRLASRPPGLPGHFSAFDVIAAKLGHWALYGLMFAVPFSGWIMVSSSIYGVPTIVFNWFEWPHFPGVSGKQTVYKLAKEAHWIFALLFALTIFVHVAAVVKHMVLDKTNLLTRMWWTKIGVVFTVMVTFGLMPAQSWAGAYDIDYTQSTVTFSGTHSGKAFSGVFESWEAEIVFDPDDLAASKVSAVFALDSAKTGSKIYDGTLPQADWFDVKTHPQGVFDSREIVANADGSYRVVGDLRLRGISHEVVFDITIGDLAVSPVQVQGGFEIDRLDYDIGRKSDTEADWVSRKIAVDLSLVAAPRD